MPTRLKTLLPVLFTFVYWLPGYAQDKPATVGDLLDRGGAKVVASELSSLVKGATVVGVLAWNPSETYETTYESDGTLHGHSEDGTRSFTYRGTWSVNDKDQLCRNVTVSGGVSGERKSSRCTFYFRLDNLLFTSEFDGRWSSLARAEVRKP